MQETELDWKPVLLVRVTHYEVNIDRAHMALHPDGVVRTGWGTPVEKREYPYIQLVGWKPMRDVPFELPVQFYRKGDPRVTGLIHDGTWVLPYNEEKYNLYIHLKEAWISLLRYIESTLPS